MQDMTLPARGVGSIGGFVDLDGLGTEGKETDWSTETANVGDVRYCRLLRFYDYLGA